MTSHATFYIRNLGCKVNRVEADTFAARLIASGLTAADDPGLADVAIINTCTVTGEADAKARKAVRSCLRATDGIPVIVTGCGVSIDPQAYRELSPRVHAEPDKTRVCALALELTAPLNGAVEEAGDDTSPRKPARFMRAGEGFMSRAGIKVQDGCPHACTYCIVHVARGPLWHKPLPEVIAEVNAAERAGVREVVLTGINLGSYPELPRMLEQVLIATQSLRVRLSSIEPLDIDDSLIELMAASQGRICRHLHLPLQSGSDRVLHEMARPYSSEKFLGLVAHLRDRIPSLSLSTDVIAGFPGETDDDFRCTQDVCRQAGFSKLHVFRYSRRAGTPAAQRLDQIDPQVKAARAAALREQGALMRSALARKLVGKPELALIESAQTATTEGYFTAAPADESVFSGRVGELVPVNVTEVRGDVLVCAAADRPAWG